MTLWCSCNCFYRMLVFSKFCKNLRMFLKVKVMIIPFWSVFLFQFKFFFLKWKKVETNIQATHFYTIFQNQYKNFLLLLQRMIVRFVIYIDWYYFNTIDPSVALCCDYHKNFSIGGQGISMFFFSHEKSEI